MQAPAIKSELTLSVPGTDGARVVVASNAQRVAHGRAIATVSCTHGSRVEWVTHTQCHVTGLVGGAAFVALALHDGSMQLLTRGGRRTLPPVALAAPAALLAAGGARLAALLTNGDVRVWDAVAGKVCPELLGPPRPANGGVRVWDAVAGKVCPAPTGMPDCFLQVTTQLWYKLTWGSRAGPCGARPVVHVLRGACCAAPSLARCVLCCSLTGKVCPALLPDWASAKPLTLPSTATVKFEKRLLNNTHTQPCARCRARHHARGSMSGNRECRTVSRECRRSCARVLEGR